MIQEERKHIILQELSRASVVKLEDLSQQLNVSIDTVRRDLKALDRAGLVQYIRGGAKAVHESHQFAHFNGRKVIHNELKREAARKAVQLIQPNDLVMLNSGTTTTILAEEIAQADLTCSIVTNNIAAAEAAAANPKCRIHLLGGDWDGAELVEPLSHITRLSGLYTYLLRHGYGEELLYDVFYNNLMRVVRQS